MALERFREAGQRLAVASSPSRHGPIPTDGMTTIRWIHGR